MDKETIYNILLSITNYKNDIKFPECNEEIDIKIVNLLNNMSEQNKFYLDEIRAKLLNDYNVNLKTETDKLAAISTYKNNFLANISHELRTPLNSILVLSKMLIDDNYHNLTCEQLDYINIIYSASNDLLNLINDILDLSKIEAGKVTVTPDIFLVSDLKKSLIKLFNPIAKKKNLDYQFEINSDIDQFIYSDRQKVEQILKNLLSNSFKFTSKGSVVVRVENYNPKEVNLVNSNYIKFLVIDTGIGVPEQKTHIIFEAFQQADFSISRRYGGTGLGLSISKQLSELLNGFIQLEKTSSKGSIFSLTIPYKYIKNLCDSDLEKYQKIQCVNKKRKKI